MVASEPEQTLVLTGDTLTVDDLERAAHCRCQVRLDDEGLAQMARARRLVDAAINGKVPVYGVTTGLGSRVTDVLDEAALAEFSYQTIRGRAHAVGTPFPSHVIRASMIVRANTLLRGAAAAQPVVAEHLVACLNARVTPVVGEIGSIGAGDLVWNATQALGLIGEGPMTGPDGTVGDGADIMAAAGVTPPKLGPRDGLALCNNASHSAALGALGLVAAKRSYEAAQSAAALTMEGFRANLSPLDSRILKLRPQPGQGEAAAGLLVRLEGSALHNEGAARRLQDPLSIRNVVQVHGAMAAALAFAEDAVVAEINGASDNPAALVDDEVILSAGAYHTPHLTNALEAVSRASVHVAMTQVARVSKMMSERFTELPVFLATPGSNSNGFAPVLKTLEAAASRLGHAAQPVSRWPSINADGVEDAMTGTPTAALALMDVADHASRITAIELLVAAKAVELRSSDTSLAGPMSEVLRQIRAVSDPIENDRPLAADIDAIAAQIDEGCYSDSTSRSA